MVNRIEDYLDKTGGEEQPFAIPPSCHDAFQGMYASIEDLKLPPNVNASARMLEKLDSVRKDLDIYIQGKNDDSADPYPKKDHPDMNRYGNLKRPSAAKDGLHQAEHRIGTAMHAMLSELENFKTVPARETQYQQAIADFRTLADELCDLGVFLDQGKNYANKKTIPNPEDENAKPSEPKGHKALFTRLNDLGLRVKSR